MCRHVKVLACRLLQSPTPSVSPFVWLSVCASGSHTPFLSKVCVLAYNISQCVSVFITDSVVFSCKAGLPPPSPTMRGILYHVSAVFRELSRKIKHRGLTAPPHLFLFSLTHSMWPFSFFFFFFTVSTSLFLRPASRYGVTELISHAACNRYNSIIMANILL